MKYLILTGLLFIATNLYASQPYRLICSDDRVKVEVLNAEEGDVNLFWNGFLIDLIESDEHLFFFVAADEEVGVTFNSKENTVELIIEDNEAENLDCVLETDN